MIENISGQVRIEVLAHGPAHAARFEPCELLHCVRVAQQGGELFEVGGALGGGEGGPGREGGFGAGDGAVGVGGAGFGDLGHELAGRGREELEGLFVGGFDELGEWGMLSVQVSLLRTGGPEADVVVVVMVVEYLAVDEEARLDLLRCGHFVVICFFEMRDSVFWS